jgi:hypothetical protein
MVKSGWFALAIRRHELQTVTPGRLLVIPDRAGCRVQVDRCRRTARDRRLAITEF